MNLFPRYDPSQVPDLLISQYLVMSQTTIIPHSQKPYVTRQYPTSAELDALIVNAHEAQKKWKLVPLQDRINIGDKFMVIGTNLHRNLPHLCIN